MCSRFGPANAFDSYIPLSLEYRELVSGLPLRLDSSWSPPTLEDSTIC